VQRRGRLQVVSPPGRRQIASRRMKDPCARSGILRFEFTFSVCACACACVRCARARARARARELTECANSEWVSICECFCARVPDQRDWSYCAFIT
jgi:hypothetical protein